MARGDSRALIKLSGKSAFSGCGQLRRSAFFFDILREIKARLQRRSIFKKMIDGFGVHEGKQFQGSGIFIRASWGHSRHLPRQ
jgi:hypothetical protein